MNNKGFAITSIIYTLLILFLLILVSVLTVFRTSARSMDSSYRTLQEQYEKVSDPPITSGDDFNTINATLAGTKNYTNEQFKNIFIENSYRGLIKYEFLVSGAAIGFSKDIDCIAYIKGKISLANLKLSPNNCNDYHKSLLKLTRYYKLEGWN